MIIQRMELPPFWVLRDRLVGQLTMSVHVLLSMFLHIRTSGGTLRAAVLVTLVRFQTLVTLRHVGTVRCGQRSLIHQLMPHVVGNPTFTGKKRKQVSLIEQETCRPPARNSHAKECEQVRHKMPKSWMWFRLHSSKASHQG